MEHHAQGCDDKYFDFGMQFPLSLTLGQWQSQRHPSFRSKPIYMLDFDAIHKQNRSFVILSENDMTMLEKVVESR